jgi:DNA modification methylase
MNFVLTQISFLVMNKIINGDSLKVLKKLEDNSVDLVCTDPPYGYSFMGKDWDKVVPSVEIWKECLRVLKPGGFCFVMSAPRIDVQSRMATKLEDAGFQTNFSPIYWTYATGFPKAMNISKIIDKRPNSNNKKPFKKWLRAGIDKSEKSIKQICNECGFDITHYYRTDIKHQETLPAVEKFKKMKEVIGLDNKFDEIIVDYVDERGFEKTDRPDSSQKVLNIQGTILSDNPISDKAKQLHGSYGGYQPKPAVEVILVCMKPMSEKTFVDQALNNGKGVTWLDDCRIPYQSEKDLKSATFGTQTDIKNNNFNNNRPSDGHIFAKDVEGNPDGRFAANLIVQDDVLNDGKNRKGGTSNGDAKVGTKTDNAVTPLNRGTLISRNDDGSFSRFYDLDAWWKSQIHKLPESVQKTFPFMIVPKASKSEKNEGLGEFEDKLPDTNDFKNLPAARSNSINTSSGKPRNVLPSKNNHPTVKPIELMSYLITLGSRENDVVVDPFVGSGTTCIAAKLLNRQYIGIEKEEDYAIIAKARIKNVESKENNKASQFFEL